MSTQPIAWKVGDLAAWESQAQGWWATKVGRITELPDPTADRRTSAGKVSLRILARYAVDKTEDVGKGKGIKPSSGVGRSSLSLLRVPTDAECRAVME
jgi:hypothetical protein